ncbi:MAG TPA: HdeD family acid-resistance protein [Pirellulales bacterium]|nr:HdeD family acid-resistance protein [Pirellulales bacterium]
MSEGPTSSGSGEGPAFSRPLGPLGPAMRHELAALQKEWWWFLLLGIGLIVLGTLALGSAVIVSFATVVFLGLLLLAAGIAQTISAFWAGRWSGFLLTMFIGLLYMVAGLFIINHPIKSTIELTLMLAFLFIVSGIFRIVTALVLRFPLWGWPLLNGVISVLLGVMIYKQWPASGLVVIGIFVGIELIFNGWAWVMFSLGLKNLPREAA